MVLEGSETEVEKRGPPDREINTPRLGGVRSTGGGGMEFAPPQGRRGGGSQTPVDPKGSADKL